MIPLDAGKFPIYYGGNFAGQKNLLVHIVYIPATWSVSWTQPAALDIYLTSGNTPENFFFIYRILKNWLPKDR